MPPKGNQFKSNSIKEENKSGAPFMFPKTKKAEPKLPSFDLQDGRLIKITGLFFLIICLYFLIAFTSYLFTWQDDQSYVLESNGGWSNFWKTPQELADSGVTNPVVQNWLGKLGALLSHQFIYEWFGVASFIFVAVFLVIGYRLLFKVKLFSISKTLGYAFFSILFLSVAIGFFHGWMTDSPHYLEGEFGFWTNRLLDVQIGAAGTAGLLIFAALTFLIIVYNIDFKLPERKPKAVAAETDAVSPDDGSASEPKFAQNYPVNMVLSPEEGPAPTVPPVTKLTQNYPIKTASPENEDVDGTDQYEFNIPKKRPAETANAPKVVPLAEVFKPVVLTPEPVLEIEDEVQEEEFKPEPVFTVAKTEFETTSNKLVEEFGLYDPELDLSSYKKPTLELLENYGPNKIQINNEELEANKDKIVETLNHYNIEIDKIKATVGPTVTLYEIIPAPGVRISKIKNLEDDIALSLAALGIRIIAPMPGKGTIGIEVPNQHPEMVSMRSIMATEKFQNIIQNNTMDLPIALGKTISNEVYIADLAKMPHLLVAGATGQGKSVGINAILVSLLYSKHPSQLKFVLVDPKKVELTLFRKIERHFLAKLPDEADAIITDTKKVINTLNSLCIEMDQRYDLLKDAQVRNLKEYNLKFVNRKLVPTDGHRFLPFIVLIVDEFADLMMTAGKEVETPIARLAQLARAVGIHLVIATQRPSVNIITGTIKANFPARLAFRVLSKIDSRTILDAGGADQLIGRGDMLLSTGNDLIRLQCPFVDTPEVEKVSDFIGNQRGYPSAFLLPEFVGEGGESSQKEFDPGDRDPLFEEAAKLIVMHQQGSTSLIQRKLKLGYNRAGRIIDQLEAAGVVGPFEGSKAREVLLPDDYALEQFLSSINSK
ncbi:FtsK/SpoIIIE family DNA translocase [Mucilaginibacter arboris]|uniref:DNA translocase FtsK n=1 Tax=Mucilaginibacter arboris TaxID=2682090 RepID=A0A7K1SYA5_9SPHI|nr:DNA translocase FtsK [Mucilaginibacter arboris]MVN22010.1 DNA translocase FtsK [Mucilaginibacter arboris]